MRNQLLSVFIAFILYPGFIMGNDRQFSFDAFPYLDQLPSNSIRRVFQDSEGYIWFGTLDGLCRYDAYGVKMFRSDLNNPDLLTNNEILSIAEDHDNKLWIGTWEGLNILDRKTMKIKPFPHEAIRHTSVNALLCDSSGNMWIGCQNGLYKYNPKTSDMRSFSYKEHDLTTVSGTNINSVYEDAEKNIWIMTWKNGLSLYDRKTDTFKRFPPVGKNNNPFRLYQDKNLNYWLCTWNDGLFSFDPELASNQMYTSRPVGNNFSQDAFFSIVQDDKYGYLWLISLTGIHVLDIKSKENPVSINVSGYVKHTNNTFSEIIKDKNGHLWIGAFGDGPFLINLDKPAVKTYPLESIITKLGSYPRVVCILEDQDGLMWLGLDRKNGCFMDRKTNKSTLFSDIPALSEMDKLQINCIQRIESLDEYWIGYNNSAIDRIKKINGKINLVERFDMSLSAMGEFGTELIREDKEGNIWIVSDHQVMLKERGKTPSLVADIFYVSNIVFSENNEVWIASGQNGIFVFSKNNNNKYRQIAHYGKENFVLKTNNISALCGRPGGNIWIGTKDGRIIKYNIHTKSFEDQTTLCSMTGESILNILEDDMQNIWISSPKKITRFNTATEVSSYFATLDNSLLVNTFLPGSCFASHSGEVFFGGNKGFCSFLPEKENTSSNALNKVLISDIKVNNRSIYETGSRSQFDKSKLTINPTDKNIEIIFSSLDYISASKIQYAYQMEGVDNSWIFGSNRRFATYNNLEKGHYKFKVKCTDENGVWNESYTWLEVYKKPAFYETRWAYLLYFILFAAACIAIYKFFAYRMKMKNQLDISRIEKEKSEELTQTKLRYFTNISHELLTPLTIISCLIEEMRKHGNAPSREYSIMKSNINRLKRLLQQILDFRKVESGNLKLKVSEGDIVAFIRDICYQNFTPLIGDKQIKFAFSFNQPTIYSYFDADKIDKVVFNLLSNAFKYTDAGGEIQVSVNTITREQIQFVQVEVSDTGRGIAPEDLSEIFNRFFHNKLADFGESNGIGLSLTKELIELHHGTIKVESSLHVGTSFLFNIPQHENAYSMEEKAFSEALLMEEYEAYAEGENTEEQKKEQSPEYIKEDINLLIVEDNEDLRVVINNILSNRYNVFMAENGQEGLDFVQNNDVDIVVSDVMMPVLDGLELCRQIKNDVSTSHIEVLLLTAKNSIDDRIACYNAGADGYISKPFEIGILEAKINSLVKNKKQRYNEFKTNMELNISGMDYPSLDEVFLKNAMKCIEDHFSDYDYNLNKFAEDLNMSKASLYRKFKSLIGLSPIEFIRNVRLKHSCQLLKQQSGSISDVAYAVGFSDPKYFTSCFKNEFGVTPSEYIKANTSTELRPFD